MSIIGDEKVFNMCVCVIRACALCVWYGCGYAVCVFRGQEFEAWVNDTADHGFVVVSFGAGVKYLSDDITRKLAGALALLPQRVVWRYGALLMLSNTTTHSTPHPMHWCMDECTSWSHISVLSVWSGSFAFEHYWRFPGQLERAESTYTGTHTRTLACVCVCVCVFEGSYLWGLQYVQAVLYNKNLA